MQKVALKKYLSQVRKNKTKKELLEKSIKNHKQNWYHFIEEPKFGNKSGTILGNLHPICRKIVPIIRKKFSAQEIFVNLAP